MPQPQQERHPVDLHDSHIHVQILFEMCTGIKENNLASIIRPSAYEQTGRNEFKDE